MPRVWWDVGEMTGSSASLEGLSRLIPLNALGPPGLSILHAQIKPNQQGPPPYRGSPASGIAPLCPLPSFYRVLDS